MVYPDLINDISEPATTATPVDRLRYLIKLVRKTQAQFSEMIDINPSNISKVLTGKIPFSNSMINRIVVNLGVSKEWLVNGTDVPFPKTKAPATLDIVDGIAKSLSLNTGAPIYDVDVTAGTANLSRELTADNIIGRMTIPSLNPNLPVVRVSGNSMSPRINNGAYISIRAIRPDDPIIWGQIYVVILEDYRMVKYVRRHNNPAKMILHSENPDFDDIVIDRKKVVSMFLVEAVLNYEILG